MSAWVANYIGLPFVDGGRERKGCDCWGLVRLVLREQSGIELPDYAGIGAREVATVARAMLRDGLRDPWVPASEPLRAFDVVVMADRMRAAGRSVMAPDHVGILVPWLNGRRQELRLLHVESAAHSLAVPLDHPAIAPRIAHIRRHMDLR